MAHLGEEEGDPHQLLLADRSEKTTAVVTMEMDSAGGSSSAKSSTLASDESPRRSLGLSPSMSTGSRVFDPELGAQIAEDRGDEDEDADEDGGYRDDQLHQMRFRELRRRAAEEDLSSVENTNCMYRAGFDKHGRAVVVFIGKWFKQSELDLSKALLYLIRTIDPIADRDYIVLYFHTRTSTENIPSYWWIKEVYKTLPYHYKKHLKSFYVVHPTVWTKMTTWWFSTFMASAIKNKIHNVSAITDLGPVVDERSLSLPMFVTEQDMIFNGLRYVKP